MKRKEPDSYLVNGGLACAVMYFAFDLSRSGRAAIDWIVLGLLAGAVAWNLFCLGQRLQRAGGGRAVWHLIRTLTFWVVGLLNTALIRPEAVGSWRNGLGWLLLLAAVGDSIALYRKERSAPRPAASDGAG